jgi:hypothetical protein
MLHTFKCRNCNKRTTLERYGNALPKHCKRIECVRERRRNQNRFSPRTDLPIKKLKVLSGRLCQFCQKDTGPNWNTCPKCLKTMSRTISGSISI